MQDVFSKELSSSSGESVPPSDSNAAESAPSSDLSAAQYEILLLIQEDLAFLLPLLKNFPKCYWIWNHRAWLLQQASQNLPASSSRQLWEGELGLVTKMLGYDSRNFHGWSYRRTVIRDLEEYHRSEGAQNQGENAAKGRPATMTEHEFAYTTKMIKTNLSNFSAWHNRLQLIPRLLSERHADRKVRRIFLDDEFDLIVPALYTDPYDQSLWFYYDYLMTTLAPSTPSSSAIVQDLTDQERLHYFETQLDTLKDILEVFGDCKYLFQSLLTYAARYQKLQPDTDRVAASDMTSWLEELEKLDPLRRGRWQDLRTALSL